jgi:predicted outer membrane repeat protein
VSSTPTISYSLIEGADSLGVWKASLGTDGGNNIDADPLFVDAANENLRLTVQSPAIDQGNTAAVPVGVTTDLAGSPRVSIAAVDMGAYEFLCPSPVAYVDLNAVGLGTGDSWGDAYTSLQDALSAASACATIAEIWVADGTYYATDDTDRAATFQLINNVAVYGGFAGGETALAQRDWVANPTILSGDIGTPADSTDNSYHVVNGSGSDSTAVLDGLTVTSGNASGAPITQGGGIYILGSGAPTLANLVITRNSATWGGGMVCNAASSPTLTNVVFALNSVNGTGGGLNIFNGGTPVLTNVTFWNNSAGSGGAMGSWDGSNPTFINVTVANNSASNQGGAIYNQNNSNPTVINTILWGNTAPTGPQIHNNASTTTISYSLIEGADSLGSWRASLGTDGGNNIDADPLFVDAFAGNLRLTTGSPAIDVGDSTAVPPEVTNDLAGNSRIYGAQVDMGAYEYQGTASGIDDEPGDVIPRVAALRSVYPNPFNPSVTVEFDLERQRSVQITIYDVRGKLVRKLVNEVRSAGTHTVRWDGTDASGRPAATGVYFLRLQSEEWSVHRKMVMLK